MSQPDTARTTANTPSADDLARKANTLRMNVLEMVIRAGGGHIGGSFSVIDVLTALYLRIMRHDPASPDWDARDRLVFSKGHSCLALYNVLAECGYFPKESLDRYCVDDGLFAGHPERDLVPGAEATTGSLGHGLPLAVGMAIARNLDQAGHRVFCVLGDGECNEGSVWEAFMAGPQFGLDCLTAIVDSNKLESLGTVSEILSIEPLGQRLANFGWAVREIDGHDMTEIVDTLESLPFEPGKPSAIVAHTTKGKGVSFMENVTMWHYRGPNPDEAAAARRELKALIEG
ncbi:MAG: transketolase [Rhodospirillales bacterium]